MKDKKIGEIIYWEGMTKQDAIQRINEHIAENYTPNTEVQKAVEEAVRGFREMFNDKYDASIGEGYISDKDIETYLQTLKDKE